jgi:hypothetical protein
LLVGRGESVHLLGHHHVARFARGAREQFGCSKSGVRISW